MKEQEICEAAYIDLSYNRSTPLSIFGKLADLLDIQVDNSPKKKDSRKRKSGLSR